MLSYPGSPVTQVVHEQVRSHLSQLACAVDDITCNKTNIILVSQYSLFEEMARRGSHTEQQRQAGAMELCHDDACILSLLN